jgi:hypothetical protein
MLNRNIYKMNIANLTLEDLKATEVKPELLLPVKNKKSIPIWNAFQNIY